MSIIKIQLIIVSLALSFVVKAQVGIGTTNPQAELDVDGGNVRFSDYGTNIHAGNPVSVLGVDADGDIIEVSLAPITDVNGLQFYIWTDFDTLTGPGIDAVDANEISVHVPLSATTPVGPPVDSGLYTGSMQLLNNGAFDAAGLRPVNNRYLILFTGTLEVVNTGEFTFTTRSDDGTRILIDEAIILEDWVVGTVGPTVSGTVTLAKGRHDIEFWFFDNTGPQRMDFMWGANPDGYTGPIQANQFIIE